MFSVFASIGLSRLIPAISLRRNTKEYIPVKKLDESASGCFSCPFYLSKQGCGQCEKKKFYTETAVRYMNEGSRYEAVRSIKKYTLLTYMWLHFMEPDQNGHVSRINPEELAKELGCTERTVVNNLKLLDDLGYIMVNRHHIPGYYHAFIVGYKDIFKKAKEGGRGFLRIGSGFLKKLSSLPDTNSIRLAIRSYLNNLEYASKPQLEKERSFREIKNELPEYVTKKQLSEFLSNPVFRSIFHVSTMQRSAVIVTLPEYNQAKVLEEIKKDCRSRVNEAVTEINKKAKKSSVHLLRLTEKDYSDIENIALKLPVPSIIYGIQHFFNTYVLKNLYYDSAGALIRTFASDHAELGFAAG